MRAGSRIPAADKDMEAAHSPADTRNQADNLVAAGILAADTGKQAAADIPEPEPVPVQVRQAQESHQELAQQARADWAQGLAENLQA